MSEYCNGRLGEVDEQTINDFISQQFKLGKSFSQIVDTMPDMFSESSKLFEERASVLYFQQCASARS